MTGFGSHLVSFYKVFRWIVLVIGFLVVFMMLRRPSPPSLPMTPQEAKQQAQSFDEKINQLAQARSRGESAEARFTSDEITAAIAQQMSEPASTASSSGEQKNAGLAPNPQVPDNAAVRTVGVDFHGDEVTGQFITNVYGKDIYITVSGRLGSKDGYATFDPTSFKFGDLVIPTSAVNDALQKKLAEPENREKLKLPDFVQSIRIENGELVVQEKK